MKKIIASIKKLSDINPIVYLGENTFSKLNLITSSGLSTNALKQCPFPLPNDYATLLNTYNGFSFLEGVCVFFSLEDAIEYTKLYTENKHILYYDTYLNIASVLGDYVFLDVNSTEGMILVAAEGIAELKPLKIGFKQFLDYILSSHAIKYWDNHLL